jgi:two-component system response regulator FixJ
MTDVEPNLGLVHVIDDEDSIRRSMDFLLRTAGYRVERWPDGGAFLKGADQSVHACVLLDIRMPGIDGLEVQERMATEGFDFPVIILTGHGDIDLAVRAMKAGAADFLVKPCDRDKLLRALERAFRSIDDQEVLRQRRDWARAQLGKLTARERQVLDGLACGYPNKTIAYDLGISSRTVEVYRANVMAKLEVGNFADALRVAFAAGLGSDARWRQAHDASPAIDAN